MPCPDLCPPPPARSTTPIPTSRPTTPKTGSAWDPSAKDPDGPYHLSWIKDTKLSAFASSLKFQVEADGVPQRDFPLQDLGIKSRQLVFNYMHAKIHMNKTIHFCTSISDPNQVVNLTLNTWLSLRPD